MDVCVNKRGVGGGVGGEERKNKHHTMKVVMGIGDEVDVEIQIQRPKSCRTLNICHDVQPK